MREPHAHADGAIDQRRHSRVTSSRVRVRSTSSRCSPNLRRHQQVRGGGAVSSIFTSSTPSLSLRRPAASEVGAHERGPGRRQLARTKSTSCEVEVLAAQEVVAVVVDDAQRPSRVSHQRGVEGAAAQVVDQPRRRPSRGLAGGAGDGEATGSCNSGAVAKPASARGAAGGVALRQLEERGHGDDRARRRDAEPVAAVGAQRLEHLGGEGLGRVAAAPLARKSKASAVPIRRLNSPRVFAGSTSRMRLALRPTTTCPWRRRG